MAYEYDSLIREATDVLYDEGILFSGKEWLSTQNITWTSFELRCKDEDDKITIYTFSITQEETRTKIEFTGFYSIEPKENRDDDLISVSIKAK